MKGKNDQRDYHPTIAFWIWSLEDSRRRTKEALSGLTQEIIDWKPPDTPNYIGTILYHITAWVLHHLLPHEAEPRGQIMETRLRAKAALSNNPDNQR